jgi:hypothetical protein
VPINIKRLLENRHLEKLIKFSTQLYIGWVLFIGLITLLPGKTIPQIDWNFLAFDKVIHFVIFSILAFLGSINFKISFGLTKAFKPALFSLFIAILYGTILEYMQTYIPDRRFDYADLSANIGGSVVGVAVFFYYNNKITR